MTSVYLNLAQLFAGWGVLMVATYSLSIVPNSGILWQFSDQEFLAVNGTSPPSTVFGAWILVEFLLLVVLVAMATTLMYCCRRITPNAGLLQLIADPVLVPLACVPFLLVRGIPVTRSLRVCLVEHDSNTTLATKLQHCQPTDPFKWDIKDLDYHRVTTYHQELVSLECCLECLSLAPVLLRLLHLRWRMAWQPFLLSALFLFLQALDTSSLVRLALVLADDAEHRVTEALACFSSLYIGLASLNIATPPAFLGGNYTSTYLRWLHICSTCVVDLPNILLKPYVLARSQLLLSQVDALFIACMLKNICSVVALCALVGTHIYDKSAPPCGGHQASRPDDTGSDSERLCVQTDNEDFV